MTGCPPTPESGFCVIPGHDNSSKPLLERLAASVVESTEGFSEEEKDLFFAKNQEQLRIYYNVIITTAELKVCNFDSSNVSLENGELSKHEFHSVPYVRFRKQLSVNTNNSKTGVPACYYEISYAKENTVFVVNASHFIEFLEEFELDGNALRFLQ